MAPENDIVLKISATLDQLGKDVAKARGQLGGLEDGVDKIDDKIKKGTGGWQASFAKFGLAINGVQQAFAILDRTVGDTIRTMAIFQTSMQEVNTLLKTSESQFKGITRQVIDLSKQVPQTADQLSKGLYQVVSAGVDAGDAMQFLETSAKGAVAGLTDTQTSVDAITSVINAYGKEAKEAGNVSDIFFQTVKLGKTTFGEMAPVLGQVIPIASAFKVPFEEVAGAFATLTKQGIPTARTATSIGRAISEIVKPASKAESAIKKLGFESGALAIEQVGLQELIIQLTESGANMASIFGEEAIKAVLALGKSSTNTRADLLAMGNAVGSTDEAFAKMSETLANQKIIYDNEIKAIYLELSEIFLPILTKTLGVFRSIVSKASEFYRDMNETSLEKSIREMKELGLETLEYELALAKVEQAQATLASSGLDTQEKITSDLTESVIKQQDLYKNLADAQREMLESGRSEETIQKELTAQRTALRLASAEWRNSFRIKVKALEAELAVTQSIKDEIEAEKSRTEILKENLEVVKKVVLTNEVVLNLEGAITKQREKKAEALDEETQAVVNNYETQFNIFVKYRDRMILKEKAFQEALKETGKTQQAITDAFIRNGLSEIDAEDAKVDRLYELGTISTENYIKELRYRLQFEEEGSLARISLENQLEQLQIERFARLRQGWKEFLKGELIDFITAKQLEMLATLGAIWAEGGATLGTSLAIALPMYGTGIAILEGAKQAVTAFADGGLIDGPTLALMGEKGREFVAPEAKFGEYSKNTLTPMIMGQVEAKLSRDGGTGKLSGGLGDIKKAVESLQKSVSRPYTVLTGTQLRQMNSRMARGSLVN